jgi:hypothetical protein
VQSEKALDPRLAKKESAADARTRQLMKDAVVRPAASSFRPARTPEFIATGEEVREHGDAAREERFPNAELRPKNIACLHQRPGAHRSPLDTPSLRSRSIYHQRRA